MLGTNVVSPCLNPLKKYERKKHGKVIHMILAIQFLLKIIGKIESLQNTFLREVELGGVNDRKTYSSLE